MPFHGIHDHSLDAKNRLTVPARFRPELQTSGVVLAKNFEPCLLLSPAAVYAEMAESAMAGLGRMSPQARDLRRHFYGNTLPGELDSAGRVMLPGPFMEYAGIVKDCVIVGAGDWLEIWDRATWRDYDAGLIPRAAEHIESIGHPA